jgi:hypothetical protein
MYDAGAPANGNAPATYSRTKQRGGAKFQFRVHPHMLRHACGFHLANKVTTRAL